MDVRSGAVVEASPGEVLAVLGDLSGYPGWLPLVRAVTPDGPGAWAVRIGARLGPLTRTKEVRMVAAEAGPGAVRFERRETDGRPHPSWTLVASVTPDGARRCVVDLRLHYGGGGRGRALLEAALARELAGAGRNLGRVVAERR